MAPTPPSSPPPLSPTPPEPHTPERSPTAPPLDTPPATPPARRDPPVLEDAEQHRRFAFGLERLVFFSDAVMAIAITLLVIDVRLPPIAGVDTNERIIEALGEIRPELFAFAISFAVIAVFWLGHYRTFRWIARLDGRLIGLDFLFLFIVALLPFPTSVVATHGDRAAGAIVYAAFVAAGGFVATLLWVYPMLIGGLGVPSVTPEIARRVAVRTLVVPIVFALSIPVALVDPFVAELTWILALPAQALVTRQMHLSLTLGD